MIICLPLGVLSQENRSMISGTLRSDTIRIENAHVINKTANRGSVTNALGRFKISAKEGDTLIISDIQYQGKIIVLDKKQIASADLDIELEVMTEELEEIVLEHYGNMAEELGLPNAGKTPLTKVERNLNAYSQKSTPVVILQALLFKPGGIDDIYNIISGNRKRDRKLKQLLEDDLRKEQNNSLANRIRADLQDSFFIDKVKIPEELIESYILYCIPKGVPRLYEEGRLIEVIDIFLKNKEEFIKWNSEDFPE
jgi:hypothetical protein